MSAQRPVILCVDDEQAVLNQLSAQLSRLFGTSHDVECTESAEEALALVDEIHGAGGEVQVVICDQVMPGMKGDRFLETVHRQRPEMMKILLTGQAGLESAIYAINHAGLHRYIEKPWEPEDLTLAVENLLTQHRLRRELATQNERLERRSRELHKLHEVGHDLGSVDEVERVLALAVEAARKLTGTDVVLAVAQAGAPGLPRWAGRTEAIAPEARKLLEGTLARLRSENRVAAPEGQPAGLRGVPIQGSETLFGWILLLSELEPSSDTRDLLSILAGQTAASLANIQLLAQRLESERLSTIGRMISTIVHDLRGPMTAIKGYGGMLEELDPPADKRRAYAHLIVEETERMGAMVDELLEFTRGGETPLLATPTTVAELLDKVCRVMEPQFQAKGIALCRQLEYAGPLTVDVDRIRRAVLNIATNALDAMGHGGSFTLVSRFRDGSLELALSDTGHGIPEELQPRIFEPFFTHGKARGIGLGMSITRKIVEEHGGRIELASRPGVGTTFTLMLPLSPPVAADRPSRARAARVR